MKHTHSSKPTLASKVHESFKSVVHPRPKQIDPLKSEPKPKKELPFHARSKEKVQAYIRLSELDAAPAYQFSPVEQAEYDKAMAERHANAEKNRKAEINKNRNILGLGPA